jgi:hypothetical protein
MIENPIFPPTKSNYFCYVGPNKEYTGKFFYVRVNTLNYLHPEDFTDGTYTLNFTKALEQYDWKEASIVLCPEFVTRVAYPPNPMMKKFMWLPESGMVMLDLYIHDGPLYSYVYAYHFDPYERKFAHHNGPQHIFTKRLIDVAPSYLQRYESAIYEALLKWEY